MRIVYGLAWMLLWRSTLSKLGQLPAIRGDQFLFHLTALDLHGNIIVICADESAAALKVRNFHQLSFRQMQNALNTLGFLLFQIQQDLRCHIYRRPAQKSH